MACRDPEQFSARVGPVCGAGGFRGRECQEAIRDALRQHGDECLATPLVPGWPPIARYVCPSTDDYIGPLCPTHGRGGATPGAASAPPRERRGHALQTVALATLATGAGFGLTALGVAKYKLNATKRARDNSNSQVEVRQLDREDQLMNRANALLVDPTIAGFLTDPGSGDRTRSNEPIVHELDSTLEWVAMAEELGGLSALDAPITSGTGASDTSGVRQTNSEIDTTRTGLSEHPNNVVRAFPNDPQNTELARHWSSSRPGPGNATGPHNALRDGSRIPARTAARRIASTTGREPGSGSRLPKFA
jgi:hypothetical protein